MAAEQQNADVENKYFKRSVCYRSFRNTASKAFKTIRTKFSGVQEKIAAKRSLRLLNELEIDSPISDRHVRSRKFFGRNANKDLMINKPPWYNGPATPDSPALYSPYNIDTPRLFSKKRLVNSSTRRSKQEARIRIHKLLTPKRLMLSNAELAVELETFNQQLKELKEMTDQLELQSVSCFETPVAPRNRRHKHNTLVTFSSSSSMKAQHSKV